MVSINTNYIVDSIPSELRELRQWVCWGVNGEKIPFDCKKERNASSSNPETWHSFDEATEYAARHDLGIGFVFAGDYCGLDLDHVADIETGELSDEAKAIVDSLDGCGYAERSPSGDGLHVIFKASKPENVTCKLEIGENESGKKQLAEFYGDGRFFTVTGNAIDGFSFAKPSDAAVGALADVFPKQDQKPSTPPAAIDVTNIYSGSSSSCENYVQKILNNTRISEGNRNNELFSIGGNIAKKVGYDIGSTLSHLRVINERCCDNPVDPHELHVIAKNSCTKGTLRVDSAAPVASGPIPNLVIEDVSEDSHLESIDADTHMPDELWRDGGFIEECTEWWSKRQAKVEPELALSGVIVFLSKLFADRYREDSTHGTSPNVYVMSVAKTGGGKQQAIDFLAEAVRCMEVDKEELKSLEKRRGSDDFLGEISSRVAFCDELKYNRTAGLCIDEAGEWLGLSKKKDHAADLSAFFKEVYVNQCNPSLRAYRNKHEEFRIAYPSPTLFFISTPAMLLQNIDFGMIEGGLVGRFLMFKGWGFDRSRFQTHDQRNKGGIPKRAKKWIGDVYSSLFAGMLDEDGVLKDGGCNFDAMTSGGGLEYEPGLYTTSREARDIFDEHILIWSDRTVDAPMIKDAMWARAPEKVSKMAILFACSRAYREDRISVDEVNAEDMNRAIAIVEFLIQRGIAFFDRASSEEDRNMDLGLSVIRKNNGSIKASDFKQKLKKRVGKVTEVQKQVIDPLVQLGKIVIERRRNSQGRDIEVISLAKG